MEKTYKPNLNMWQLDTDADHILHRIGSEDYTEIRHTIVKDPDAWEEVAVTDIPPYTKSEYDAKVAELVREKYTADEEFALHRKMFNAMLPQAAALSDDAVAEADAEKAMEEYAEYNAYVEQCKLDAPAVIAEDKERAKSEEMAISV